MTQPWPAPVPLRARVWPVAALAILAVFFAAAALTVTLGRSGPSSSPTYTAAQRSAAKAQLCEQYKLAAHAMHIETTGPDSDIALARISMVNGALILETAASNPAIDSKYRDAAHALAISYQTMAAMGTKNMSTPEQWQSTVDNTNAKTEVMEGLCGD